MSQLGPVDDQPAPDRPSSGLRRQLSWTALFVLIALGGAGLATAADRPATDEARPELTWRGERAAEPMLDAITSELSALDEELATFSGGGRDTLVGLRALDPARIEAALAAGDASSRRVEDLIATLAELRRQQASAIDDRRLGTASQEMLAATDAALDAAAALPARWAESAFDARRIGRLLEALVRHDGLVFRATTAGRQERFDEALELLGAAEAALVEAQAVRGELAAADVDTATLDELLRRYGDYDIALTELYLALAAGGAPDGEVIGDLVASVDRAQAALPPSNDALHVIVAEASGPAVTEALVRIEEARGAVGAALAAARPADEP